MAVMVTMLTGTFARMGDPYVCEYEYKEQNRDARGVPVVYLQRSVQHTGCSPKYLDGSPVENYGDHKIDTSAIFVDVAFWYIVLFGATKFFRRIDI